MTKVFNRLNIAAVTQEVFDSWDTKRQKEYLDQHPNSKFVKQNGNNGQSNVDPKKMKTPEEIKKEIELVQKSPWYLLDMENPSPEAVDIALEKDGRNICYVNNPTPEQERKAIDQRPMNFFKIKNPSKSITDYVAKEHSDIFWIGYEDGWLKARDIKKYFDAYPEIRDSFAKDPKLLKRYLNAVKTKEEKQAEKEKRVLERQERNLISQQEAEEKRKAQEKVRTPEYKELTGILEDNKPISLAKDLGLYMSKTPSGNYKVWFNEEYLGQYDGTGFSAKAKRSYATPEDAMNAVSKFLVKDYENDDIEDALYAMEKTGGVGAKILQNLVEKQSSK